LHECGMPHNVLHMVMNDIFQWSWFLLPLVHTFWVNHQSRLGRAMVHPICGYDFLEWAYVCSLLVVHNLQP
jgi:hypothetical protein